MHEYMHTPVWSCIARHVHTQRRGQAQAVCKEMAAAFAVALQEKTLLLLPGLAASPPPQGKAGEWAIHTRRLQSIVTLTGVPMVGDVDCMLTTAC